MASSKRSERSLKDVILKQIQDHGPMSIFEYMEIALGDADQGYYRIQDPLGQQGDFTTAPEISQVFGELIGAWFMTLWDMSGRPSAPQLIEVGPGRGTLMSDILRTSKLLPDFLAQVTLHFVETSPALRKKQQEAVKDYALSVQWHDNLAAITSLEKNNNISLFVANEFLDALPIRHFVKQSEGQWKERCVDATAKGELFYSLFEENAILPDNLPRNPSLYEEGDIFEFRPAHQSFVEQLGQLAKKKPLFALLIDYGYIKSQAGDTFQAMKSHRFTDPLLEPGHADLTAHVDFEDLKMRAQEQGLIVYEVMTQGQFLMSLGLAQRTEQLLKKARKDEAQLITTGAQRLVDPTQMGQLFKVMVLSSQNCPVPPPFTL